MEAPKHPRRVLVIDDNRDSADTLALLLRRLGHYVRVCYDGLSAVDAARQVRPHVVFLDLYLPGLDGFEVVRRLRSDPQLAHILVVAVTGASSEEDRERGRAAGVDYHLVKPADLDFIRSLLGRRR